MQKTRPLQFARQLRHNQTLAETKLWGCLRKRSLGGYRFNRQVSVGPYFVDFLCREKALVIEVDGATHGELSEIKHDARRTAFLAAQGLEVCRINNEDIYKNLSGVLTLHSIPTGFPTSVKIILSGSSRLRDCSFTCSSVTAITRSLRVSMWVTG